MSNMKLEAVMDFQGYPEWCGEKWCKFKPLLTDVYIIAYNYYATNFDLEPVNKEWDALNPDIHGMDEGSKEWYEYNRFVAQKATAWVDEHINSKWPFPPSLKTRFFVDEHDVLFTGYELDNPSCKVTMHLEPII